MRTSKFTEEQILELLRRVRAGRPTAEVCRSTGVPEETVRQFEALYASDGADAPHVAELEAEVRRLEDVLHGISREVNDVRRAEAALRTASAYVALLQDVAVAANEAATPSEAMMTCLRLICEVSGWHVGH